jgi:hypothetical protein
MATPATDTASYDAVVTSDDTPTMIALIAPEGGWYGRISAIVHAYKTSDKSVCAAFQVDAVAGREGGTPTVYLTDVHNFISTAQLINISGEFAPGAFGGENHVLLMATGHATIELEWHVRTTTMFEAA